MDENLSLSNESDNIEEGYVNLDSADEVSLDSGEESNMEGGGVDSDINSSLNDVYSDIESRDESYDENGSDDESGYESNMEGGVRLGLGSRLTEDNIEKTQNDVRKAELRKTNANIVTTNKEKAKEKANNTRKQMEKVDTKMTKKEIKDANKDIKAADKDIKAADKELKKAVKVENKAIKEAEITERTKNAYTKHKDDRFFGKRRAEFASTKGRRGKIARNYATKKTLAGVRKTGRSTLKGTKAVGRKTLQTIGKASKVSGNARILAGKAGFTLLKKYVIWFLLNIVKIIQIIIVITIIIAVFKQLKKIIKEYPRFRGINGYLDIAGKFDKSSGLDTEMGKIISKSFTDYIFTQHNFKKLYSSDPNYNYIEQHLFTEYNNTNTNLHNLLCRFIKYKDEILKTKNFVEIYFKDIITMPTPLDTTGLEQKMKNEPGSDSQTCSGDSSESLSCGLTGLLKSDSVKITINSKLDIDPTVNLFINDLQIYESIPKSSSIEMTPIDIDTHKNIVINDIQNINEAQIDEFRYEYIYKIFSDILTTIDNKDNATIYNNLFYRNVLYAIILKYSTSITNDDNNGQLQLLEKNNLLAYINPNIKYKINEPIYELYGKYLNLPNASNGIITFKEKFNTEPIDPNIKNILDNVKYVTTIPKTKISIDRILRNDINFYKNTFINQDIFKNDFVNIWNILDTFVLEYNSNELKIKTASESWKSCYNNYKNELNKTRGAKYDTGNKKLNIIYGFNNNGNKKTIINKFDIINYDIKTKYVIEIFNILIIIENFINNYDAFENDTLYESLLEYLWSFEYLTTLKIYNTAQNKYIFLLSPEIKKNILTDYHKILKLSLYFRDRDIINTVCFINIKLRQRYPNNIDINEIRIKLLDLSSYYLSFMEIKLFENFINDLKEFKEQRTAFEIYPDYIAPKTAELTKIILDIYKGDFTPVNINGINKIPYKLIRNYLDNDCNFLFGDYANKLVDGCPKDTFVVKKRKKDVIEGFSFSGILSPLLDILKDAAKSIVKLSPFSEIYLICKFFLSIITSAPPNLIELVLAIFSLIITCSAKIIKVVLFSTEEYGIASSMLWPFSSLIIMIIIFLKSFILLLILIILIILGGIIIILDSVFEKLSSSRNEKNQMKYKNIVSKFIYKNFLSCENSPHSWYKNSRYDLENKSSRGFFCKKPCRSNYRLSEDGDFCEKAPTNVPYYCPQPLLFRYFRNEKITGKNYIEDFISENYPLLLIKDNISQINFINNFKKNKKEYYESCQNINDDEKKNYNIIGKNICAYGISNNVENGEYKDIKKNINAICKQTYCENGNYENFCYKYEDEKFSPENIIKDNNKFTKYLKILIIGIILYSICIYIVKLFNIIAQKKQISNPFNRILNRFKKN